MDKPQLQRLLDAEIKAWAAKPYQQLLDELVDVEAYERGAGEAFHQFEVQIIEREEACLHVLVSIDDGGLLRSFSPLTRSFFAHQDGRVEL